MPPIVPALCIETGYFMRHGKFLTEISLETLGYQALDRLFEWLIGSLFLAPVIATLAGIIIYVMAILITKKD
jgi:ABC-type multidrug transport system permease subunit